MTIDQLLNTAKTIESYSTILKNHLEKGDIDKANLALAHLREQLRGHIEQLKRYTTDSPHSPRLHNGSAQG